MRPKVLASPSLICYPIKVRAKRESVFEREVVKTAKSLGIWCSQRLGADGFSDRIMTYKNRVYFVEFKTNKGRLTDAQKTFKDHAKQRREHYIVLKPKDDYKDFLFAFKNYVDREEAIIRGEYSYAVGENVPRAQ